MKRVSLIALLLALWPLARAEAQFQPIQGDHMQAEGGAGLSQGAPDLPPGGNVSRGNPWDSIGNRRGDGSAIHDLEDMTGQKIGSFHSSGSGGYGSGGSFSGLSLAQERVYQERYRAQLLQLQRQELQNQFNRQMAQQFANLGAQLLSDALFGDHGQQQAQLEEQRRLEAIRRAEEERRRREEEERQRRERVALAARQRREADEREQDFSKGLSGVFDVGGKKHQGTTALDDDIDEWAPPDDLRDAPISKREPPPPIFVPPKPKSRWDSLLEGADAGVKRWLGFSPADKLESAGRTLRDVAGNLTSREAWKVRGEGVKELLGDQGERVSDSVLEEQFGLPSGAARNVYKGGTWLGEKTIGGLDKAADLAHSGTDSQVKDFLSGYNERKFGEGVLRRAAGDPDLNYRELGDSARKVLTGTKSGE